MGSCVSVHKDSESAMKLRFVFGSKTAKLVNPSPPLKDNSINKVSDLRAANSGFHDLGSKEETFFDSQAWLDSDCDDDFLSVNGDFTPSRGNTPLHHDSILAESLMGNKAPATAYFLEQSSPTDKKKRLSELFQESLRMDQDDQNKQNAQDNQSGATSTKKEAALPKSTPGTPYVSVCNSERTPNRELKYHVKSSKQAQCCLPRLSRSFSERRKRMSPAPIVGS